MRSVRVGVAWGACLVLFAPIAATAGQAPQNPPPQTARIAWTLIGGGSGFGAGLVSGLFLFDDAVNGDRKVWTTAVAGAIGGGIAGNLLSRPSVGGATESEQRDSLWNGMAIGAAAGAVVGLWYVPARHCKPEINPECPSRLRLGVGIPAIAGGAGLGALVDRLVGRRASPPAPSGPGSRALIAPILGPGTIGVFYSRSFR